MFARLVISFAVLLVSLPLSQAQTSEDGDPLESYLAYQGENFLIVSFTHSFNSVTEFDKV